jgi:hypothetical protein
MYLWDSNIFIEVSKYPVAFSTFWSDLESSFASKSILTVSEVKREIESVDGKIRYIVDKYKPFIMPTPEDLVVVSSIMRNSKYAGFIKKTNWLQGKAVADPFIVAVAKNRGYSVVTNESFYKSGARIPDACKEYQVECIDIHGFFEKLGWKY